MRESETSVGEDARKGHTRPLLVGMENGVATVKNPHRTPQKPQFLLPSLHPKGLKAGSRTEPRTPTFI